MKDEYDFSNGVRGKFYRKDAVLKIPVSQEPEVRRFLSERAKSEGNRGRRLGERFIEARYEMIEAAN